MEVKCKFDKIKWQVPNKNLYSAHIKSTSIQLENQITTFVGEHEQGKFNKDIESIYFEKTIVNFFPRGLIKVFPNLKRISIQKCGLKKITKEDLVGLENIEEIYFTDNELKSLPDNLFEGMQKLKWISFQNNKIEQVTSKLLQPIHGNNLELVNFQKNPKINATYEKSKRFKGLFKSLPNLMQLIDENHPTSSPADMDTNDETMTMPTTEVKQNEDFLAGFVTGFKYLWSSGNFSDFTIIIDDRKFHVHKCILSIRSEHFKTIFAEKSISMNELKNEGFSAEAVEEVLKWMYTGEIPSKENAVEALALSVELSISLLVPIAENLVTQTVNQFNAMKILELGDRFGSNKLKEAAFGEMKKLLGEPELDESLMENLENLRKLIEAKKNFDEMLLQHKKRKLN